jgi:hypothetical protein
MGFKNLDRGQPTWVFHLNHFPKTECNVSNTVINALSDSLIFIYAPEIERSKEKYKNFKNVVQNLFKKLLKHQPLPLLQLRKIGLNRQPTHQLSKIGLNPQQSRIGPNPQLKLQLSKIGGQKQQNQVQQNLQQKNQNFIAVTIILIYVELWLF